MALGSHAWLDCKFRDPWYVLYVGSCDGIVYYARPHTWSPSRTSIFFPPSSPSAGTNRRRRCVPETRLMAKPQGALLLRHIRRLASAQNAGRELDAHLL